MPTYTVADYLIDRLTALGAEHLFGVPGNYTAEFLTAAQSSGRLTCVGTTNELEAGYAADAYARIRPIGVACVTYGVGSFSLYNAVAGSYVERCPVVVLNGSANADKAEQLKNQGVLFAHAIDTLRTDEVIFRPVTAATAVITDPADAPAEIDRVLRACVGESRPVYLEVRDRVWLQPSTPPKDPKEKLAPLPRTKAEEADIDRAVAAAVADVLDHARKAKNPVLWGGELLQRRGLQRQFEAIVNETDWAYTTTLLGKALIAETNEHFLGVYDSGFAPAGVRDVVEKSDCVIALGTILSDFYGAFVREAYDRLVLAGGETVRVGRYLYPNVPIERFVPALAAGVKKAVTRGQAPPPGFDDVRDLRAARSDPAALAAVPAADRLTWDTTFARLHQFVGKGMRVMVDTSLALFPAAELVIAEADHFIAQTAWLSIGYTTGAAVGASFAASARVVALAGDGGFQMVPQVLSTLAAHKKPAVVVVFNNGLYGIEQYLVDKRYFPPDGSQKPAFFNQLAQWDYVKLAEALGAKGFRARTAAELDAALAGVAKLTDVPALVEVVLEPTDLPAEVRATVKPAAAAGLAGPAEPAATIAPAAFN